MQESPIVYQSSRNVAKSGALVLNFRDFEAKWGAELTICR